MLSGIAHDPIQRGMKLQDSFDSNFFKDGILRQGLTVDFVLWFSQTCYTTLSSSVMLTPDL